jgi:hypothetical protein
MSDIPRTVPQGLNRLRKNPEWMEKIPKRVPQGLNRLRKKSLSRHFFSTGD